MLDRLDGLHDDLRRQKADHLLSIEQLAEYLGVSVNTARGYIASGDVEACRLSDRVIRIDPESVRALLRSKTI